MKNSGKSLVCLLCAMVLSGSLWAATSDAPAPAPTPESSDASAPPALDAKPPEDGNKPYSAIWLRNVFDLKPVPPPPPPTETNAAAPPPGIKLVGLAKQGADLLAILVVTKPPEAGKQGNPDQTFIMSEGNRRDAVEMLHIDLAGKKVKINLDGEPKELTLETNRSTGGGPGPGGGRGGGGMRGGAANPGGGIPVNSNGAPPPGGRTMRGSGGYNNGASYSPQGNFQPNNSYSGGATIGSSIGASAPGLAIPGSAFNQSPSGTPTGAAEEAPPPEVTAAILAAQKALAAQNNRPFPPIPPSLDVSGGSGANSEPEPPAPPSSAPSTLPPSLQPVFRGTAH